MREYNDEKILEVLNTAEKVEKIKNLESEEVVIGDKSYIFEEMSFFDDGIRILIPNNFIDMNEAYRKIKYPNEDRPKYIKCNNEGSICFTFKIIDSPLDNDSVEELTKGMKDILKRVNPSMIFFDLKFFDVEDKKIGYFDFKSSVIDGFIYNVMYFFELNGKTVFGGFSCLYKEYEDWKLIVEEIIQKIKFASEENISE